MLVYDKVLRQVNIELFNSLNKEVRKYQSTMLYFNTDNSTCIYSTVTIYYIT